MILLLWWGISASGLVPEYMLPSPGDVIRAFIGDFPNLMAHALVSVEEALAGLLIGTLLAFLLACAMDRFLNLERAVLPLLVVSQTIPAIAIAPLRGAEDRAGSAYHVLPCCGQPAGRV